MFRPGSTLSVAAFVSICMMVTAAILAGITRSAVRDGADPAKRLLQVLIGGIAWIGVFSLVVGSGWVEAMPMPRLLILFAGSNLVSIGLGLSPVGRWLSRGVPIAYLVGFQAFRLPLELVLHSWAGDGVIPNSMTWTGANWDIISGVVALLLAPLSARWRTAAWLSNGVGIVLLANVARVAVWSSPLPFAWPVTPPLQLAFHLPYAWIVPVCVGGAIFGHVVLTRALLKA